MNFFEDCVNSFDSMDSRVKDICDSVWNDVSYKVQDQKLTSSGIFDPHKRQQILTDLKQRPSFLVHVALKASAAGQGMKTFVEVGTAQGLQSIIFAKALSDSLVYTCDIKDDRHSTFSENKNVRFVLGDAQQLSKKMKEDDAVADLCWIDGSHDHYAVVDDFLSLMPRSTKSTIWAFDDYDSRFGCFRDLNVLIKHFEEHVVLDLGLTASGNPNRIVVARGLQ
jgi:hypothetical protein